MHCRYLLAFLFITLTSTLEAQRTAIDSVNLTDTTVIHVVKLRDGSTLVGRITAVTTDSASVDSFSTYNGTSRPDSMARHSHSE